MNFFTSGVNLIINFNFNYKITITKYTNYIYRITSNQISISKKSEQKTNVTSVIVVFEFQIKDLVQLKQSNAKDQSNLVKKNLLRIDDFFRKFDVKIPRRWRLIFRVVWNDVNLTSVTKQDSDQPFSRLWPLGRGQVLEFARGVLRDNSKIMKDKKSVGRIKKFKIQLRWLTL